MRIYCIKYSTTHPEQEGIVIKHQEFAGSDGAASKRCTEIKKSMKDTLDDKPEREAIDIPTKKDELIAWLNNNASLAGVVIE